MMTEHEISGGAFDTIIAGGAILDGSGEEAFAADIGIVDDRIRFIGDLSAAHAPLILPAQGRFVAPGFIDIHTHSDVSATYLPGQASALAMGVTTQVVGNCGLGMGFALADDRFAFEMRALAAHGARIRWSSFREHLDFVEAGGIGTNYVPLAGQGTLRKRVIGLADRRPDANELAGMRRDLEAALEAGAWGLSSGLEYPPSSFADEEELTDLCRVVAAHGGIYATHLRNEGDLLVEAVQEALNVTERAGVPLQLSHHKAEGRVNWGKVRETLDMVDRARERGNDVQMDQYPYTAFMTSLSVQTLPRWALTGTAEELTARLTDPVQHARILSEIRASHPDWQSLDANSPWHLIRIGVCRGRPELQGESIAALSQAAGVEPIKFVLALLAETGGYVSAVNFSMGEEDIATVMRYPWTSIGSDGVGTNPGGTGAADHVHPRSYGTFPRVLGRYVRELGILDFATAIHKMTGLPAARMGLKDRGRIAVGQYADITVFDPEQITDRATFEEPHQYAGGIDFVLVNGRVALEQGAPKEILAGRVLRRA